MKNVTPIKDLKTTPLTEDNATAGTWVVVEADNLYQHKVLGVVSKVELYESTPFRVKISLFPSLLFPTNDPGMLMHVDSEDAYYTPTGEPTGIHAPLLESRVIGVLVDQPVPYYEPTDIGITLEEAAKVVEQLSKPYDGPACDDEYTQTLPVVLKGFEEPVVVSLSYGSEEDSKKRDYIKELLYQLLNGLDDFIKEADTAPIDDTTNELFHSIILTLPGHDKPIDLSITYHNLNKSVVEVLGDVYYHLKKEQVKEDIKNLYASTSDSYSRFEVKEKAKFVSVPSDIENKVKELEGKLSNQYNYLKSIDDVLDTALNTKYNLKSQIEGIENKVKELEANMEFIAGKPYCLIRSELKEIEGTLEHVEALEGKLGSVAAMLSRSEDRYKELVERVNALLLYSGKEDQLGGLIKEEKNVDKLIKLLGLIDEIKDSFVWSGSYEGDEVNKESK